MSLLNQAYLDENFASINGVKFHLTGLGKTITHRHVQTDIPGSYINPVDDMGFKGLELRIMLEESNRELFHRVIHEFSKTGEQVFKRELDWKYLIYVQSMMIDDEIDYKGNYKAELTAICKTPFKFSEEVLTKTISINSVDIEFGRADDDSLIITTGEVQTVPVVTLTSTESAQAIISQTRRFT